MVRPAPSPVDDPDAYVEYVSQFSMPIKPQVAAAAALESVVQAPICRP